jgi:hypothetical protein
MSAASIVPYILFKQIFEDKFVDKSNLGIHPTKSTLQCGVTCSVVKGCRVFSVSQSDQAGKCLLNKETWNCKTRSRGVRYWFKQVNPPHVFGRFFLSSVFLSSVISMFFSPV